ncbi:OLC1v1013053C1 [Oldenlandia corymbosa var. corymbosa]|uniref:OLC1v1013053C1 n=1 Tax=Oldenlandia corymbosa var. corymbosa TaxID=529605 RepID=A0AAV1DXI3_OLDCO|nr:OLC1v1013053C1 [Oldenlandia corymbosa var. corymbosa]
MNVPSEKPSSSGLTQKEKNTIVVDIESSPPKQKETGIKKNTEYSSDDQPRDSLNLVVATSANKFAVLDTIQEEEGEIVEDVTVEDGLEDSEPTENSENRQNDASLPPQQEGSADLGPELSTLEAFQKELSALDNDTVLSVSDFADDGVIEKNSEIGETIIVEQESWSEGDMDVYEDQERVTAQGGDFNVIRTLEEYSGVSVQDNVAMTDFNTCIEDYGLMELLAVGEDFTWGGTRIENLNRTTSDHSPILHLFGHQIASKPKVFRFQKMWQRRSDFKAVVKECWDQPLGYYGMHGFLLKLRQLKVKLREWNKGVFGDVFENLKSAEANVQQLESLYDMTSLERDSLVRDGAIAAYGTPSRSLALSHLAFADDLIIFTRGLKNSLSEDFCEGDDVLVWQPNTKGDFSVKSAYEVTRRRRAEVKELSFVWAKQVPLRISFFIWKLHNKLLPFPEILSRMGLQILPSICPFCKVQSENIEHVFFGCHKIMNVWSFFAGMMCIKGGSSLASMIQSWWQRGDHLSAYGVFHILMPTIIIWETWKARNKVIFEGSIIETSNLIFAIKTHVGDLLRVHDLKVATLAEKSFFEEFFGATLKKKPRPLVKEVRWIPPPSNSYVLNTDGSSALGEGGYGFVIRGKEGTFIYSESGYLGGGNSYMAEIAGALFRKCEMMNLSNVYLRTDNQSLAWALNHPSAFPWRFHLLFQEMLSIILRNGYIVSHVFREANFVADKLAKNASFDLQEEVKSMNSFYDILETMIVPTKEELHRSLNSMSRHNHYEISGVASLGDYIVDDDEASDIEDDGTLDNYFDVPINDDFEHERSPRHQEVVGIT